MKYIGYILTVKAVIALAVAAALVAGAVVFATHVVFTTEIRGDVILDVSFADPLSVYLVSGDGSLEQLVSGDSIDFGVATVDFFGVGSTPSRQIAVKNSSSSLQQVIVTGDLSDGILPLFGPTTGDLHKGPENGFILPISGDAGDTINGYVGLSFLPPLTAGSKQTTIIFSATDVLPQPPLITYYSTIAGNNHIFSVRPDGAGRTLVTPFGPHNDYQPRWSPDGSRIAFESTKVGGYSHIFVINADGSDETQLTFGNYYDYRARWSPDGSEITFESNRTSYSHIFTADATTGAIGQVTSSTSKYDYHPVWSPDGSMIAFRSSRGGSYYQIFTADLATGAIGQVTPTLCCKYDYQPEWSPDSSTIVFRSNRGGSYYHIYTADAINGATTAAAFQLTSGNYNNYDPVFSPDGSMIAWECLISYSHICVMNADGSDQTQATSGNNSHYRPTWSLDSTMITFDSKRSGYSHIFTLDVSTTAVIQVTATGNYYDYYPHWSPAGDMAALALAAPSGPAIAGIPLSSLDLTSVEAVTTGGSAEAPLAGPDDPNNPPLGGESPTSGGPTASP